jgi:Flp pilus assembly protein TadB
MSRPGRRRRTARRGEVPAATSFVAAVGAVAAALRVGAGPEVAWRRVGVRTDDGVPRAVDLAGLGGAGPRQVAAVVAAARLSSQVGTPAAEMLERATVAVTRDVEAEGRRRAALAGPRATANLLVVLPGAGLVIGVAVGARPWEQLLGGGAGSASALVGLALLLAGRRWTAREIRAAERAGEESVEGGPMADDPPAGGPVTRPATASGAGPRTEGLSRGRHPRSRDDRRGVLPTRRRLRGSPGRWGSGPAPGGWPRREGPPGRARVRRAGHRWGSGGGRLAALGADRPAGRGVAGAGRPALDGRRRSGPAGSAGGAVEPAVLLDLVDGACQAGVGVPQALDAVGAATGGTAGADLRRAARRLTLGAPWAAAWHGCGPELRPVARALRPAWEDGVPPGALLRGAAESVRRARDARAAEAAARLGVRLVVPLGLCHLPAFVLVGLVPVLSSMATTTLGA